MSVFQPTPLALLLLLATTAPLVHAQQPRTASKATRAAMPPAAPAPAAGTPLLPPPPPAAPGGPGRPGPERQLVQELHDFTGTLTRYIATNDEQLVDGFVLSTGSSTDTVRLPRHAAQQLMATAKAGSRITVSGYRHASPEGRSALHLVSLTAGGQTVTPAPPVPPTTPPAETTTTVKGTVRSLRQDRAGRVNGLVLADQTLVGLPPQAAYQLATKLQPGATVEATGFLHAPRAGEVALRPVRSLRAETLTLNGVRFLLQ